ncbi:MAG: TonB-dependent receptor plug domain-containing protein [Bacteroidota bacterium]|nr:TonB-dependent receptor plug domain-containing protein [Bacteroidota bacterium]MDX5430556.1 TonB-dependent receptor plug domain-containing protein [Bacteroidota bacterium]MDX5469308.1 TonB-dependent receptor plug domain-containing protein [Bacteroidota bacterium]
MKKAFVHTALFFFTLVSVKAQDADTLKVLREVEVRSDAKKPHELGQHIQKLEPGMLQFDLAQVLQASSGVAIKSYGPGMLSSLSLRGTGAAHTAILWHGLNIQNGMNGQQDLSLIPGFLFDNALLISGTQNQAQAGGLLGGSIQLNHQYSKDPFVFDLGMDLGSFGTERYRIGMDLSRQKWTNRTRVARQHLANRFTFQDRSIPGNPVRDMEHAEAIQTSIVNDFNYFLNPESQVGLSVWYNEASRQIPPTLINASTAKQFDQALRAVAYYEKSNQKGSWVIRSGIFNEQLNYTDLPKKLQSANQSIRWTNHLKRSGKWKRGSWEWAANYQYDQALATEYLNREAEAHGASLYGGIQGNWKRIQWHGDIRQEKRNEKLPAPSLSMGAEWSINATHKLLLHAAHVSRLPNFNDLYWNPGGNPNLQPEQGWSGELGYRMEQEKNRQQWVAQAQLYYSVIRDWITWLPQDGFWTPQNLKEVHNRGFEWQFNWKLSQPKWKLSANWSGSFTLATNERTNLTNDLSLRKQLIYVPFWKNVAQVTFGAKHWSLVYRHHFTGGRYTSADHSSYLMPFDIGELELQLGGQSNESRFTIGLSIQNIWNQSYEVIEWRPMPGRYFQFSMNYKFIQTP